jgi:hypothetical protein
MNGYRFVSVVLLCLAGAAGAAAPASETEFATGAASRTESPQRAAANRALREFSTQWQKQAGTLPRGFPFDVKDLADLAGAKIGYGFRVHDADPASLVAGDSLDASARDTGQWRFNVVLAGRPVGLITLVNDGGAWQAVSFGGAKLAAEIDAVAQASPGESLRYVRVPQATADFIEVGKGRYAPLQAARESLNIGKSGLVADAELAAQLREGVARNLAE